MASQIAHIVYADKFFKKLELGEVSEEISRGLLYPAGNISKDEFIIGSTFPDIRRIDTDIKRKYTHMYFPKIDLDFLGLSSFEAGWKFHLYCDMRREEILNKYDFYSLDHAADHYHHPAKILEDELVYDDYNNWEKIASYFNHPTLTIPDINISRETFALWYAVLAKYIEKKPDERSTRIFLSKQVGLPGTVDELMGSIARIRKNKKATEILMKVKEEMI